MRLIKVFAYSLLGFVLYELYLGLTEGTQAGAPQAPARSSGRPRKRVDVQGSDGGQIKRSVGRGVVH
jgi:hypothetical protein